jgi:hypothetical protein
MILVSVSIASSLWRKPAKCSRFLSRHSSKESRPPLKALAMATKQSGECSVIFRGILERRIESWTVVCIVSGTSCPVEGLSLLWAWLIKQHGQLITSYFLLPDTLAIGSDRLRLQPATVDHPTPPLVTGTSPIDFHMEIARKENRIMSSYV